MERMSGKLHLGDGKVYYLVRCETGEADAFEAANPLFIQPEKPPTQRVAPEGFEAQDPAQKKDPVALPPFLVEAAKDPRFQRFIEQLDPDRAKGYSDSFVCARDFLATALYPHGPDTAKEYSAKRWRELLDAFSRWDVRTL